MKKAESIIQGLDQKLCETRIKKNEYSGFDHIESWDSIRLANDVFGFLGWSSSIDKMEKVAATKSETGTYEIAHMATVTITVDYIDDDGVERQSKRQGSGVGLGFKKKLGDAYDMSIKNAETDAEKRAFRKFGHPFGLALYDKERKYVSSPHAPKTTAIDRTVENGAAQVDVVDSYNVVSSVYDGLLGELNNWKESIFCVDDLNTVKFMEREGVSDLITQLTDEDKNKFKVAYQVARSSISNSFNLPESNKGPSPI